MNLLQLLSRKKKVEQPTKKEPTWQINEGCVIIPAFELGGKQYYCLEDSYKTFTERGFQALAVYDEWNNRMTHDMMKAFINEIMDQLSGKNGQVDLNKVFELVQMVKERVEWPVPTTEILWKMAGVSFFDESESPYVYDEKYARKKIQFWKDNVEDKEVFFCNVPLPLRAMFPLPNISVEDLKICEEVISKATQSQLESIIGMTSNQVLKSRLLQELKLVSDIT
jgi:hypothetical protein